MTNTRYLLQLQKNIATYFNTVEFRQLCFQLNTNYEYLAGRSYPEKVLDFVEGFERNNRISELVAYLEKERPGAIWTYQTNIFISYKRHAEADEQLAGFLNEFLTNLGHNIFIDQTMRMGTEWLDEIDYQIKQSDYMIVLLSKQSAHSEMVQAELKRANDYRYIQGLPKLLPVRLAYDGLLPYKIDAFLSQIQYILWESEADNTRVAQEIISTINGQTTKQKNTPLEMLLSDQRNPVNKVHSQITNNPQNELTKDKRLRKKNNFYPYLLIIVALIILGIISYNFILSYQGSNNPPITGATNTAPSETAVSAAVPPDAATDTPSPSATYTPAPTNTATNMPTSTVTKTPTATMTPTPAVKVILNTIFVRKGPNRIYDDIGTLTKDDTVTVLGHNGNESNLWYKIYSEEKVFRNGSREGWISNDVIERVNPESITAVPTLQTPIPPTLTPVPTATIAPIATATQPNNNEESGGSGGSGGNNPAPTSLPPDP